MARSTSVYLFRFLARGLLVAVPALLLLVPAGAEDEGAPRQPGAAPAARADEVRGLRHFDESIRYVSRGHPTGIPRVRDFYVKLDAKLDLDATHHEGAMDLWFEHPAQYRQELRAGGLTTVKILNGDRGWIVTPDGRVQNLLLSEEGRASIRQIREDRARLSDITQFLTLQALKGPDVTFTFVRTETTQGRDWLRIVRRAPRRGDITFWLAYEKDPRSTEPVATWPGIVRVESDPGVQVPTEDYLLHDWDHGEREFRYPRRIEAYAHLRDARGQTVPSRFLWAVVEDVRINAGIDAGRFTPAR